MMEIIGMLAAASPEEMLVDQLKESIQKYEEKKMDGDKDALKSLAVICQLILMKLQNGDSMEKAMEMNKEMEEVKNVIDAIKKKGDN